jgi:hypothetical protein
LGLGLKSHWVISDRANGREIEIASCIDLEGHRGSDNRFYLLDFSRALPPAHKPAKERLAHDNMWPYYHMFRSEFVARWKRPLSADACSPFQSTLSEERARSAKLDNQEICEATEHLLSVVVDNVCASLLGASHLSGVSIVHTFHQEGLNMRYIGRVYERLMLSFDRKHHSVYHALLAEGLMRVFKNHLRSCLRRVQASEEGTNFESTLLREAARVICSIFVIVKGSSPAQWNIRNSFAISDLCSAFLFKDSHAQKGDSFYFSFSICIYYFHSDRELFLKYRKC